MDRAERRKLKKKRKRVAAGRAATSEDIVAVQGAAARASAQLRWGAADGGGGGAAGGGDGDAAGDRDAAGGAEAGGSGASAGAKALRPRDVQRLLVWALGDGSRLPSSGPPQWIALRNKPLVRRAVVVALDGVDAAALARHAARLARLAAALPAASCRVPLDAKRYDAGGGSLALLHPLATESKSQLKKRRGRAAAGGCGSDSDSDSEGASPFELLLTVEELNANNYPSPDEPGFVAALDGADTTASGPEVEGGPFMFGVDCEMVETSAGLELARLTIVDDDGEAVVDMHVKPERPVLDYHTRYSGITAETLEGVEERLEDAQAALLQIVNAEDILVGHSLENDLRALRVSHSIVIDTAVCFQHPDAPRHKHSLRHLVKEFLGRVIQQGGQGHDSAVDADCALELAHLKLKNGVDFGNAPTRESLFDVLSSGGCKSLLLDTPARCRSQAGSAASIIPVQGPLAALQMLANQLQKPSCPELVIAVVPQPDEQPAAWAALDAALGAALDRVQPNTLVLLAANGSADGEYEGDLNAIVTHGELRVAVL